MNLNDLKSSASATVSIADTASVLDVDPRTVSEAIKAGTIPSIRVGRRIVVPREPLLSMLTVQAAGVA